jgi:hypothetical protein
MYNFSKIPYQSSRLECFIDDLLLLSKTGHNDYLIIEPYSIGDVIHTLSLLPEFRKRYCNNGQKINLICNKRCVQIVKTFKVIDNVTGIDCGHLEFQFELIARRFGFVTTHMPIVMAPDMHFRGKLAALTYKHRITPIEARALILDLDLETMPQMPPLNDAIRNLCKIKASEQGLIENSIIVFNHANSIKPVVSKCYYELRDLFNGNIYFDEGNNDPKIPGWGKSIKIDLEHIPYYVEMAGSAICMRSGITDILGMADVKFATIYPNSNMMNDWMGDKFKMSQVFSKMTLKYLNLGKWHNEIPIYISEQDSIIQISNKIKNAFV